MTTAKKAKPAAALPARAPRPWAEHPQPIEGGEYTREGADFTPTADEAERRAQATEPAPAPSAPQE